MIKVGSESFRKCPWTIQTLSLSFGVVRLSRKLFRKYGQARSHQKTELLLRETQVKVDFGETEISQLPARICSFESYL